MLCFYIKWLLLWRGGWGEQSLPLRSTAPYQGRVTSSVIDLPEHGPSILARVACLSFQAHFRKCCSRRHQGLSSGVLARTNRKHPWWQAAFSGRPFGEGSILATFSVFSRIASWLQCSSSEPFAVRFSPVSWAVLQAQAVTLPSLICKFQWHLRVPLLLVIQETCVRTVQCIGASGFTLQSTLTAALGALGSLDGLFYRACGNKGF